ncbi:transcriptional regulator, IclR family [Cryobacterium flavum]|uniref:IclR family transcriptional regulator n=1 Tax=Cryobacterium flavum TaxID=1424659 RepID=A0A4V3IA65_9MICO|nr:MULTISPECIES: IclR family transcriptional regulator [Cryobacterium]TFB82140.1 IclR family transcriptional regulator [Cryobacterium flavum]SDN88951.1 transcriptional regulator, IclR family [Cryobacterium flavum]
MSQTVRRAIEILEFCSVHPRELKEVAAEMGVHRTTALRLVQTLTAGGFVRRDELGRYGVGFRLAGLAQRALDQFDLRSVVHPHIVALGDRLGHTIQFAVPQGDHIIYVDKIEPAQAISLNTRIGDFVVIHTAGVSKATLANLPPEQRDAIIAQATFEKFTPTTITARKDFLVLLETVREQGWATDDGEFESFTNCIAAPVWDHANAVVGGISVTAFKNKADLTQLRKLLPELLATTTTISKELGWRPPGETEETSGHPLTDE